MDLTMKTVYAFFVLIFVFANSILANPVSEDSARVKAERLLSFRIQAKGKRLIKADKTAQKVVCMKRGIADNEPPTYFIFGRKDNPGFAIIAGDDCMPALIGYSLKNNIDVDNIPDALKLILSDYDLCVKYLRDNGKAIKREVGPLEPGTPVVGPYIQSTWNQRAPYNWLTPIDSKGEHTPTGCVPTAAAQILNYYKWPKNSFYRFYNWNDMQDSYGSGYSDAEGMAVATLMRDLGAIMETSYNAGGSTTSASSFTKIPGYICTQTEDLEGSLARGPLAISISDQYKGFSHAVITDGYDSNGLYHINWGWGGSCDGYYNLNDLAIIYNNKEIHPSINTSYSYLLEPDYQNENEIAIPAAYGGVSINTKVSKSGQKVVVTLYQVKLATGNKFDGTISCMIYKIKKEKFDNYTGTGLYGDGLFWLHGGIYEDFNFPLIKWSNNQQGDDINIEIELGTLNNGYYVFVPRFYNYLDRDRSKWRPFIQFAEENLVEDIPFEYKDGEFYFKEVPCGDFDIDISQIVTASAYHEKGKSNIISFIENKGSNNFTGTLTAKLGNTNDANDIKTIDIALYVPAHYSNHTILNTSFDFTGSYCLKEIEIWKDLPTGERKTYLNKTIDGSEFTILPYDSQSVTTDFYGRANVQISWKNDTAYVNDSIFKYEEANLQFYAYSLDADTAAIDVDLWAIPFKGGLPLHLRTVSYPLSKNVIRANTIGGSTANCPLGDYRLFLFGRCGNNTIVFSQPDTIGKGYQNLTDYVTENIVHVFDPGIDVPMLKLNKLSQVGDLFYETSGFVEAEIKNNSSVAFQSYISDCLVVGSEMTAYVSPFRIMSGEVATIYPRLYLYKDYAGTGGVVEDYFRYKTNNGIRDLIIPIDGNYHVQFVEKPELLRTNSNIAFYYKNNLSQKPSYGFYSKGILNRSLWKDGELIASFSDMQTDSTYNTYSICPEGSDMKDIPTGNYLLKVNLTDVKGYEWPTITYPVIIDEEELPIKIEKVEFDKNRSFSYDDEIPVIITVKNPTPQVVSTLLSTSIHKKVEGKDSWYWDSEELHPVLLPAEQSSIIRLDAHLISQSTVFRQNGTFQVVASVCKTKRGSGHLDFGSGKGSESIILPHVSSGIKSIEQNAERVPVAYYTIDGKCVSQPPHGLYIIKYNDGTVGKKFAK